MCTGVAQCYLQPPDVCQVIWESTDGICRPDYDDDGVFSCTRILPDQTLDCEYWSGEDSPHSEQGICLEGCDTFSCVRVLSDQTLDCEYWSSVDSPWSEQGICLEGCETN